MSGESRSRRLRHQLIASFVVFAVVLGVVFAVVTLLVFHRVEDRLLRQRLAAMIEADPQDHRDSNLSYVGPVEGAPAPFAERLRDANPGYYEWEEDDQEAHGLLVDDPQHGRRTVALVGFSESEEGQSRWALALFAGVGATSLLALVLARALAVRIVSPIERLTERLASGPLDAVSPAIEATGREDEIGLLTRALRQAGEELLASSRRERRFLREASHELRTPITVIQGVSDLLRESTAFDEPLAQERLDRLDRGLRRMNTAVLSLLAIARAEHRLAGAEMPAFEQQIDDLIEEVQTLAAPGVEVGTTTASGPRSPFAASMLVVVLSNLVRNAVQHTTTGTVTIEVDDGKAVVRDTGPGLPESLLTQLRSTGPQPDVGIGLATVQRICKRFEWSFEIVCPDDGGTVATVGLVGDRRDPSPG